MKFRAYAILIAAVVVAAVLAFVLPGQSGQMAAMMAVLIAVMTAFSAFVGWPPGAAFVEQQSRLVGAVGYGVVAIAGGILVWGFVVAMAPEASSDASGPYVAASLAVGMTGFLLISAPRISRQSQEARARQDALKAAKRQGYVEPAFDGVAEARDAWLSLARDWRIALRIAWPWLLCALGAIGASSALLVAQPTKDDIRPAILLLLAVLATAIGLPTTAVAWHRWLIERRQPPLLVLPNGRVLSYLWRLWIFASVTGRATTWVGDAVSSALQQAYPAVAKMGGAIAGDLLFLLACAAVSSFALRLPAVAVRDKTWDRTAMIMETRRLGLGLPLGLFLSVAPLTIANIAWDIFPQLAPKAAQAPLGWPDVLQAGLAILLCFLTMGSAVSLLSRAYLAVKARSGAPI